MSGVPTRPVTLAVDGDREAGFGHLSRGTAIAMALEELSVPTTALALGARSRREVDGRAWEAPVSRRRLNEATKGAVLVLDSYHADRVEDALAGSPDRTAVILDQGGPPPATDLVVGLPPWPAPERGRALTGLAYVCLRRDYWTPCPRDVASEVERVLVTTGGTDKKGLGLALAVAVAERNPSMDVAVVSMGPRQPKSAPGVTVVNSPRSLHGALAEADVVVTAAGQTMLEALALGAPTIAMVTAENQRPGARIVAERGLALVLEASGRTGVLEAVAKLAGDQALRVDLAARAQAAVDGQGARRVARALAVLACD
jgi:spore coat polysaccharide biosynthesis predicted glycosyltransferase SpsG